MTSDRDIARHAADLRERARDVGLVEIPVYTRWSERKLREGDSPALIAHLDAMSMFLLPEDIASVTEAEFDELLEDLRGEL